MLPARCAVRSLSFKRIIYMIRRLTCSRHGCGWRRLVFNGFRLGGLLNTSRQIALQGLG